MDGEISYESDISESWSLIDINLNEEFLPSAEISSEVENSSSPKLKTVHIKKINDIELEDFLRKFKEKNNTEFNQLSDSDSDSDSDSSFNHQALGNCGKAELDRIDFPHKVDLDNYGINDSGDAESIEILHMDGNCQEIDGFDVPGINKLEFAACHLDDEESLEERSKNENRSNISTVIKRKRRRIKRNLEDTVNNINSENRLPTESNLNTCSNDTKEELKNFNEGANKASSHLVYKHYRNNVANTILNLSMCVIFAGVACIAIGHFLGVQNAADTAIELMETLKKLQLENSALQSRLFHINRALLTRDMNQKLELSLSQPHSKSRITQQNLSKAKDADLNNAALSEIQSSLNSIEWLSKLQNFVRKNNKETEIDNGIDFKTFGKYIHDELCFLNGKKEEGTEHSENTDRLKKISKVLRKIINLVSTSKDNIEKLYQRLIKLKDKLNYILGAILLDTSGELEEMRSKYENRVPTTKADLQTMQWNPKSGGIQTKNENPDQEYPESVALYKFPQSEDYYKIKGDIKSIKDMKIEPTKSYGILNKKDFEKAQNEKNQKKYKQENIIEKKKEKKNWKRKKIKEKNFEENKRNRRKKLPKNILNKIVEKMEKSNKMYSAIFDSRRLKYKMGQGPLNETKSQSKIYPKSLRKDLKFKRQFRNMKNSKLKEFLLPKLKKDFYLKKNQFDRMYSIPQCFNLTGHWIFKWADGREEYRRYQSFGEWQFERAKARKEARNNEYNDNWQFERAKGRKELRGDENYENWQFKRALARENNRNDIRSRRGKHTKYVGKGFFHERFSWI